MPGTQDQDTVKTLSYIPIGEDDKTALKDPSSPEEAESTMLGMAGNNTLLIFDFDQTITNQPMHNFFVSKSLFIIFSEVRQ